MGEGWSGSHMEYVDEQHRCSGWWGVGSLRTQDEHCSRTSLQVVPPEDKDHVYPFTLAPRWFMAAPGRVNSQHV